MKRTIALILILTLLLSTMVLPVFATVNEGTYNGYYYSASLTNTNTSATASLTYTANALIHANGTIYYINTSTLATGNTSLYAAPKRYSASKTENVPGGNVITSVLEYYYISGSYVTDIEITVP